MLSKRFQLPILSLSHLLVDGICAAVLLGENGSAEGIVTALLIYNTLAFSTQCLTGMLPDRFGRAGLMALLSSLIMAPGALLSLPLALRAVFLGLGNSLFHVSGGYMTLQQSSSMTPLGIFVAPGAVGLFLGGAFPWIRIPALALLLLLSGLLLCTGKRGEEAGQEKQNQALHLEKQKTPHPARAPLLYVALLLIAVAARAVGGYAVTFPWKSGLLPSFLLTAAVFLGKSLGGILADRFGIRWTALLSVIPAILLTLFCAHWMLPSLLGQWAINLSMPITLYLLFKLYPDSPGFAFGLAASALWPGVLLGSLINLTGFMAGILASLCFAMGLGAVILTERRVKCNEEN